MSGVTGGVTDGAADGAAGGGPTLAAATDPELGWVIEARAQGLIPSDALPASSRPWPVLLLTGLAAWLAVLPVLFAFYELFGSSWTQGPTDYVIGLLLTALSVVVLRRPGRALFLEQLAVPLLITGLMSLGHGLDRDLPGKLAELSGLALVALLIAVVPVSWLRLLLGAAAAVVTAMWLRPSSGWIWGWGTLLWCLAHALAALGIGLLTLQVGLGRTGRSARVSAALEPVMTGWWVVVCGSLAWSAGDTFLSPLGDGPSGPMGAGDFDSLRLARTAVSVLLALGGAWLLARAWGVVRPGEPPEAVPVAGAGRSAGPARAWWLLPPVLALAALSGAMTALGASLALLALMLATRRRRLAVLAGATVLWVLGSFYYQWDLPLRTKALMLVAAGALLGAWAGWVSRSGAGADRAAEAATSNGADGPTATRAEPAAVAAPDGDESSRSVPLGVRHARWWLAGTTVLALGFVNVMIVQKQRLIAEGRPVFVRLAPVDPRSLMQGDYMRLSYALPGVTGRTEVKPALWGRRPRVAVALDVKGVAGAPRLLGEGEAVPAGLQVLALTPRVGGWTLASDAWFFKEGEAARWAPARYGEFRVLPDGRALLVGLVGEDLKPL